ncbi:MAG: ABC transporter ATP-binding protein [Chloroflexi bacterium]|nr:ABC transporter ATP-binding protein [Chloroflexota bacterium]
MSLELEEGKFLALLGPSGCGKTTLLRLIAGLERPDSGTIEVGERIVAGKEVFVPPEKRRVGLVFQDYALFPHMDVGANVAFGVRRDSNRPRRVEEVLSLVGLRGLEHRMPHQLSGGQQQRVALARALAPRPTVLLLDEPFSNLDADLRVRVRVEVRDVLACAGVTVVFVTHDQEEALFMGDLVGVMNAGRLEQIDSPEGIFHRPATPFVAQFIGTADFLTGQVEDRTIISEVGHIPLQQELPAGQIVKIMVRPDFIDIEPAETGRGIVTGRIFQGIHYLYSIRLPSGAVIRSLQHHNREYPPGLRVALRMNPGHRITYFVDERSAGGYVIGSGQAVSEVCDEGESRGDEH